MVDASVVSAVIGCSVLGTMSQQAFCSKHPDPSQYLEFQTNNWHLALSLRHLSTLMILHPPCWLHAEIIEAAP